MFSFNVYSRGIRRAKCEFKISNSTLIFTSHNPDNEYCLRKGDIVAVDKFFLGIRISSKQYTVAEQKTNIINL